MTGEAASGAAAEGASVELAAAPAPLASAHAAKRIMKSFKFTFTPMGHRRPAGRYTFFAGLKLFCIFFDALALRAPHIVNAPSLVRIKQLNFYGLRLAIRHQDLRRGFDALCTCGHGRRAGFGTVLGAEEGIIIPTTLRDFIRIGS